MILLKSNPIVENIIKEITPKLNKLQKKDIIPTLAIIKIGTSYENDSYIKSISNIFSKYNVKKEVYEFPHNIDEKELIDNITKINNENKIHGIIILRPIPKHIDEKNIRNLISKEKDVDGITDANIASIFNEGNSTNIPCTPKAVMMMFDYYKINLEGEKVLIIGRSNLLGKPLAHLLLKKNATVTVAHTKTKDLEKEIQNADIIISAAGSPSLITQKHINKKHIIIDIGTSVVNSKLCGDVNFKEVENKVKMLSPVKNGIGKLTTYILLLQLVNATNNLTK